jgi:protein SCO1/2
MSRYLLSRTRLVLWLFVLLINAPYSFAHHPDADLDRVMGSKEKYFQIIDRNTPAFVLRDGAGNTVTTASLGDKIIVLHFVYTNCPDVCPLHAERIAGIQSMINQSPMKDMVEFITITTDPANDTADILKAYGPTHGLDSVNWSFLTTTSDQPDDMTRKLAEAFGHKFIKANGLYQVHSVVTHIIDRNSRWTANFHGLRFEPVNVVLYINGLINNSNGPKKLPPAGIWDRFMELF